MYICVTYDDNDHASFFQTGVMSDKVTTKTRQQVDLHFSQCMSLTALLWLQEAGDRIPGAVQVFARAGC
jgi:hypothetical protein